MGKEWRKKLLKERSLKGRSLKGRWEEVVWFGGFERRRRKVVEKEVKVERRVGRRRKVEKKV